MKQKVLFIYFYLIGKCTMVSFTGFKVRIITNTVKKALYQEISNLLTVVTFGTVIKKWRTVGI